MRSSKRPSTKKLYAELPSEIVTKNLMKSEERPDVKLLEKIYVLGLQEAEREVVFQTKLSEYTKNAREAKNLKLLWMRSKADNAFAAGEYAAAIKLYGETLQIYFGGKPRCMRPEFYNSEYISSFLPMDSWQLHIDLVVCCVGIAQSFSELGDNYKVNMMPWIF